jgi:hypothetical protein
MWRLLISVVIRSGKRASFVKRLFLSDEFMYANF